jgi:tRNA (guanine37-N1)-methyltransferase
MRFDIVTLFPEIFSGYLTQSLLSKAIDAGLVDIVIHDLRQWSTDLKHRKVDDRPFGGGPGMLIQVEPVIECVEAVQRMHSAVGQVILLTPQGEPLRQPKVEELSGFDRLILLCGRYEGFDYDLNGGEGASMVVVDATIRMIPGVLGDEHSSIDDSFSRGNRILEYPQYTRPREYRNLTVPEVLLNGNHEAIAAWRAEQSQKKTLARRKDLLTPE